MSFGQRKKEKEQNGYIRTQYLAEHARQVIAVEIDDYLIPILKDTLSAYDNIMVIHNDILKVDVQKLCDIYSEGKPLKVVANLPYYITTPIIMGLFESHVPLSSVTKWRTECRWDREPKIMERCLWPSNIMPDRKWLLRYRQAVLFRGLMWEAQLYV